MNINIKNKTNIIIIAISVVFLSILAFMYYRMSRMEERYLQIMSQSQESGSSKDGRVTDPYISGPVTMDWQVNEDGEMISPSMVRSSFTDAAFHSCMAKKIAAWHFPEPPFGRKKIRGAYI